MDNVCHFCAVNVPQPEATERYGEPVCNPCAALSHKAHEHFAIDGCVGEDEIGDADNCPWAQSFRLETENGYTLCQRHAVKWRDGGWNGSMTTQTDDSIPCADCEEEKTGR